MITYGAMVHDALEATEESGDSSRCSTCARLVPLDTEAILASVRKTARWWS